MLMIGFLFGLGFAALIIFLYNILIVRSSKYDEQFKKEQARIMAGLKEKKNSYEKEFTKEVEEKLKEVRNLYEREQYAYEQKREDIQTQQEELKSNYESSKRYYENQIELARNQYEEDALAARQALQEKNEKEITEKTLIFSEKLRALEDNYKEQSQKLEQDFKLYSEQMDQRKEVLEKQIKDYEEQQQNIIEQFKQAEELKEQQDFYHIKINDVEKQDLVRLKRLALEFSKPEIIYKLMYDVYYKARLEELFKRVLAENKDKGGIYKITNINNQKAYVGRCVHFIDRWRVHSKRGCNIDRISGQLYDAMWEDGLENYTFQIIEICDKDVQGEREKYWIKFYHTETYGYNSKAGG